MCPKSPPGRRHRGFAQAEPLGGFPEGIPFDYMEAEEFALDTGEHVDYLLDFADGHRVARSRPRILGRERTGAPAPADAAAAVAVEPAPVEKSLVPAAMVLALLGGNVRYPVRRG